MKDNYFPRFPLSKHIARTHFNDVKDFSSEWSRGITPKQLKSAYNYDRAATGKGVRVFVISAFDNVALEQNLRVFCETFSLPDVKIQVLYPYGRAESETRNWLIESSLDTQWIHAFAPDAELTVVFSRNSEMKNLLEAARYAEGAGADIVAMCFGSGETGNDIELSELLGSDNCIFVSSSGDMGGVVSFPSSFQNVISVGGTKLRFDLNKTRIVSESAWENSGGGMSRIFEIPPWQGRFFNIYEMTNGMRGTPDVSMAADMDVGASVYVSSLGGWTTAGGTSLSAACFAGVCACIRQNHPEIKTGADMLSFLYGRAGTTGYDVPQYYFRDITMGMSGEFRASFGWDFCTGLGSPVIRQLVL